MWRASAECREVVFGGMCKSWKIILCVNLAIGCEFAMVWGRLVLFKEARYVVEKLNTVGGPVLLK